MRGWLWVVAALAVVIAALVCTRSNNEGGWDERSSSPAVEERRATSLIEDCGAQGMAQPAEVQQPEETDDDEEELTPEEKKEREEEARVDDFDNLTDQWMEPATNGVTMVDVDRFLKQFAAVPKDRQEECLQRALNLVPDENVMLLVGVLMDKRQDKELVELVFNDILNRDEDVKNPILQKIVADKTHVCWKDAAWILDVEEESKEDPEEQKKEKEK